MVSRCSSVPPFQGQWRGFESLKHTVRSDSIHRNFHLVARAVDVDLAAEPDAVARGDAEVVHDKVREEAEKVEGPEPLRARERDAVDVEPAAADGPRAAKARAAAADARPRVGERVDDAVVELGKPPDAVLARVGGVVEPRALGRLEEQRADLGRSALLGHLPLLGIQVFGGKLEGDHDARRPLLGSRLRGPDQGRDHRPYHRTLEVGRHAGRAGGSTR